MLTKLTIRNFKHFDSVEIELGEAVVFLGPNNSGKTTALQALALWEIGARRWNERRKGKASPEKRPGVTINRKDLISIPVPAANLLWRDLHVRDVNRTQSEGGKRSQKTENVRIDIIVEGVTKGESWRCGFEFDYANPESFYCRPFRLGNGKAAARMEVPEAAEGVRIAFLPPMSGLAASEPKWEPGRVNVLLGEGQTAQVLRNMCYQVYDQQGIPEPKYNWDSLVKQIVELFGVELMPPKYIAERGEITMEYREKSGTILDLSSSGRGLQQTLLLLAHLYANKGTVLLSDEPDAHLEILRQRQIYRILSDTAHDQGSQLIAASHSEVVLNEAADRDVAIAFVGKPHRIDDRGSQVAKALKEIGFEHYYLAEQTGWVLYLEGATDLAILRTFAETLNHAAFDLLDKPFVHYVGNMPNSVRSHFHGLREAKVDLVGIAIFDRLERPLPPEIESMCIQWKRREIENYLCFPEVLLSYTRHGLAEDDLLDQVEIEKRRTLMQRLIKDLIPPVALRDRSHGWWLNTKVTDDFLDPLFEQYFATLKIDNRLRKTDYHRLAALVPRELLDKEIAEKLDAIFKTASRAKPIS